jgi:hypothetical protein
MRPNEVGAPDDPWAWAVPLDATRETPAVKVAIRAAQRIRRFIRTPIRDLSLQRTQPRQKSPMGGRMP